VADKPNEHGDRFHLIYLLTEKMVKISNGNCTLLILATTSPSKKAGIEESMKQERRVASTTPALDRRNYSVNPRSQSYGDSSCATPEQLGQASSSRARPIKKK
jgi:hypothetical protein